MKKITIILVFFFLFANISRAGADSYKYSPYIGAVYTFGHDKGASIKGDYSLGGIYIGSDYSRYFSTELFLNQSATRKNYPERQKAKTSYRSYGLDMIAALPCGSAEKIALLGTVGIGEYVFKIKNYPQKHSSDHGYGYRCGGGLRYIVSGNWQLKILARYVKFDHVDVYDRSMEYSLGVEYHF